MLKFPSFNAILFGIIKALIRAYQESVKFLLSIKRRIKEHINASLKAIAFFLPFKGKIFFLFLLMLFSSTFFLFAPVMSQQFIDNAFVKKSFNAFFKIGGVCSGIFIFSTLSQLILGIIKKKYHTKISIVFVKSFIRKYLSYDLEFFRSKSLDVHVQQITGVTNVAGFIVEQAPGIFVDIARLFIIAAVSLHINVQLTILLLVLSPLFILHNVYIRKKISRTYKKEWQSEIGRRKRLHEIFSKISAIKAFGAESVECRSYIRSFINNTRAGLGSFQWILTSTVTSTLVTKLVYAIITWYGGWLIIKGRLSVGSFTAVMLYINQLSTLIRSLSDRLPSFAKQSMSMARYHDSMNYTPKIKEHPEAVVLDSFRRGITFEGVSFGYDGKKKVLNRLSLVMPAGKFIAIAGASGCGKTTLINLILRLYDPQEGKILVDDIELIRLKLQSLRSRVTIATQEPLLFDLSIRDNISFGLHNLRPEEIKEAAEISQAHYYIEELPRGYDSIIGEDAFRLSQGYKQRITLARAIVRRPDLFILDEATASIDSFTEAKIYAALRQKRQGLSTIVVSHRLFSIRNADMICFFKKDGTIEQGSHDMLVSECREYREFFKQQLPVGAASGGEPFGARGPSYEQFQSRGAK